MKSLFNASWRTTVVGALSALIILGTQAVYLLDSDPNTVFSIDQFTLGLGMLGIGLFARDNNVSSENAGAK